MCLCGRGARDVSVQYPVSWSCITEESPFFPPAVQVLKPTTLQAYSPFQLSTAPKCPITDQTTFFFPLQRTTSAAPFFIVRGVFCFFLFYFRGSWVLDKDSTVSVEFQDFSQSLLGCSHSFFGPFAWKNQQRKKKTKTENQRLIKS